MVPSSALSRRALAATAVLAAAPAAARKRRGKKRRHPPPPPLAFVHARVTGLGARSTATEIEWIAVAKLAHPASDTLASYSVAVFVAAPATTEQVRAGIASRLREHAAGILENGDQAVPAGRIAVVLL